MKDQMNHANRFVEFNLTWRRKSNEGPMIGPDTGYVLDHEAGRTNEPARSSLWARWAHQSCVQCGPGSMMQEEIAGHESPKPSPRVGQLFRGWRWHLCPHVAVQFDVALVHPLRIPRGGRVPNAAVQHLAGRAHVPALTCDAQVKGAVLRMVHVFGQAIIIPRKAAHHPCVPGEAGAVQRHERIERHAYEPR